VSHDFCWPIERSDADIGAISVIVDHIGHAARIAFVRYDSDVPESFSAA